MKLFKKNKFVRPKNSHVQLLEGMKCVIWQAATTILLFLLQLWRYIADVANIYLTI